MTNQGRSGSSRFSCSGWPVPGHAQGADTAAKAGAAPDSALLTPAIIDQGRKIFHGQGNCYACHGDKLEGGPIAPSLKGPTWRHIDGSYDAIMHRVDEGMPGTAMVGASRRDQRSPKCSWWPPTSTP